MENIDATVIATSLPMIAQSPGEDPIGLKLALTLGLAAGGRHLIPEAASCGAGAAGIAGLPADDPDRLPRDILLQ